MAVSLARLHAACLGARASLASTSGRRTSSRAKAQQRHGIFHRRRAGLAEHGVVQRHQPVLVVRAPWRSRLQAGVLELGAELRRDIGGHRDAAMPAMGHVAQRRAVLARDQQPVLAAGQCARGVGRIRLAVASFTPMMFGMLGQPRHGLDVISTIARPGML